jgi:hypothetical protein
MSHPLIRAASFVRNEKYPTSKPSHPFVTNVIGAYCAYGLSISAIADPVPPAMNPPIGPKRKPLIMTNVSPKLKYPLVATNGILRIEVATAVNAVRIANNE